MTDAALASAWVNQLNGVLITALWMVFLSFLAIYLSVAAWVGTRFAAARGWVGGGSHV
jgi:hypothetical protein